jgi:hypothetical protein
MNQECIRHSRTLPRLQWHHQMMTSTSLKMSQASPAGASRAPLTSVSRGTNSWSPKNWRSNYTRKPRNLWLMLSNFPFTSRTRRFSRYTLIYTTTPTKTIATDNPPWWGSLLQILELAMALEMELIPYKHRLSRPLEEDLSKDNKNHRLLKNQDQPLSSLLLKEILQE